jgi:hypothetical protein
MFYNTEEDREMNTEEREAFVEQTWDEHQDMIPSLLGAIRASVDGGSVDRSLDDLQSMVDEFDEDRAMVITFDGAMHVEPVAALAMSHTVIFFELLKHRTIANNLANDLIRSDRRVNDLEAQLAELEAALHEQESKDSC